MLWAGDVGICVVVVIVVVEVVVVVLLNCLLIGVDVLREGGVCFALVGAAALLLLWWSWCCV